MTKANNTIKNSFSASISSEASGNKCKKALPIKAPADKETKNIVILESVSFLKNKNNTANHTDMLIKKQAIKIFNRTINFI